MWIEDKEEDIVTLVSFDMRSESCAVSFSYIADSLRNFF